MPSATSITTSPRACGARWRCAAGIWLFREPARLAPAIVLGLVLGSACGVHVSLFILQLPLVGFYLLEWLRGAPLPPRRSTLALALAR